MRSLIRATAALLALTATAILAPKPTLAAAFTVERIAQACKSRDGDFYLCLFYILGGDNLHTAYSQDRPAAYCRPLPGADVPFEVEYKAMAIVFTEWAARRPAAAKRPGMAGVEEAFTERWPCTAQVSTPDRRLFQAPPDLEALCAGAQGESGVGLCAAYFFGWEDAHRSFQNRLGPDFYKDREIQCLPDDVEATAEGMLAAMSRFWTSRPDTENAKSLADAIRYFAVARRC